MTRWTVVVLRLTWDGALVLRRHLTPSAVGLLTHRAASAPHGSDGAHAPRVRRPAALSGAVVLVLCLLALWPALAVAAAPTPAAAPIAPPAQWESYRVLSDRNMFVRDRSRPRSSRPYTMPTYAAAPNEDDRLVLTGVINQGPDYVAFFEDSRTGKTITVQVDVPLGRGRVTAMAMDSVDYTYDGRTTRIAVGSSLSGVVASLSRPAAPLSTPAAGIPVGRVPTPFGAPPPGAPPAPAAGMMGGPPAPAIGIMAGPLAPETGPMDEPPVAAAAAAGTAPLTATSAPGAPPASAPAAPAASTAPTVPTETGPLTVAPPTTSPPTALPPTTTPPAAAGPSAGTKDGGAAAILERMRQRREQELNK